jgi:hypothetical protein
MSPVNSGTPVFSTSTEHSKIVVEAANQPTGGAASSPSKLVITGDNHLPPPRPMSPLTAAGAASAPSQSTVRVLVALLGMLGIVDDVSLTWLCVEIFCDVLIRILLGRTHQSCYTVE